MQTTTQSPASPRRPRNTEDLRRRSLTVVSDYQIAVLLSDFGIHHVEPFHGCRHDARLRAIDHGNTLRQNGRSVCNAVFRRLDDPKGAWQDAQLNAPIL